jgi:hypothetical protein
MDSQRCPLKIGSCKFIISFNKNQRKIITEDKITDISCSIHVIIPVELTFNLSKQIVSSIHETGYLICEAFFPKSRAGICKRLRSPGIDSASLCSLAGPYTANRVVVPTRQAVNRFLGSLKGYKFGLSTRFFMRRISYNNVYIT